MTDSITAYEKHAHKFQIRRDTSRVGSRVADKWSRSLSPGAQIIEIACGAGVPVTQTLVDAGLRVWAIDASPSLMSVFKQRFPNVPAQCCSVLDSDFFGRQFDAAISIGLIFLLDEPDQIKMLQRVSEILKPGASFLFTAPLETGGWTDTGTGHSCVSLGQDVYKKALKDAGFRLVECYSDSGKNNYYETEKCSL